jgi:hypothetical protein
VLTRHCDAEGTDVDRIAKTVLWSGPVPETPEAVDRFATVMAGCAKLGVTETILMPAGPDPVRVVAGVGERIVPAVADL